ncbi:MAG: hypothetical protein IJN17_04675 [Clostridia bacterium]|nr:hypothetical protein [Clostridia bacterium]
MQRSAYNGEFTFPRDGVMLTETSGERIGDTLKIRVAFTASDNRNLTLNGEPMDRVNHCIYKADAVLENFKNTLTVKDTDSGEEWSIDVYFLKRGYKKYRFSLDDNIWFLQNLNENKDVYKSMFEDPYLALLKSIHDKHGSKFHINIYYETPRHGGFNLSQMTDKYKEEFKANSDWMRLSFHANADKPDRPYIYATYEQAYFEMERVHKEILRFAGEEVFAKTVTTVHWGDCSKEAAKAFRDLGVKAFVSSYNWNTDNNTDIRMYFDAEQCAIIDKFGYYYDKEMDIYHFRYNGGIQRGNIADFPAQFDRQRVNMPRYEFRDFCLHEQYFYPEFHAHMPDYYEKLDCAATWCKENGFEPIFMDELFEFDTH